MKEDLKKANTAAGAAAVLGGGAGNAGKLTVLNSFGCEVDDVDLGDEPLDWEFHPTTISLGSAVGRYKLAAMVMNPVVVMCIALLVLCAAAVMQATLGYGREKAISVARFPGILYVPYLFLLQGTSLVAAQVVFDPSRYPTMVAVLSYVTLALCLLSPVLLYTAVLRHVKREAELFPDPAIVGNPEAGEPGKRANSSVYKFAFGTDIWVSRQSYFAEKYGNCFENVKPTCLWYILCELAVILCLSLLSGWQPTSVGSCNTRNIFITILLVLFFVATVVKRPFLAAMDNLIAITLSVLMASAVLGMTIAIAAESSKDSALYAISSVCLLVSALMVMVKCVWDFGIYAMDVLISRRSRAREQARCQEKELIQNDLELELVSDVGLSPKHSNALSDLPYSPVQSSSVLMVNSDASGSPSPAHAAEGVIKLQEIEPPTPRERASLSSSRHSAPPSTEHTTVLDLSAWRKRRESEHTRVRVWV